MSYLVLARKWRPQNFDEVVNQKHVVLTLRNALKTNRLANAYLFTGPRGIGKTTVARILAKSVNCDRGMSDTPCNECSTCKEITASRSLDVFEIDGASNTGVDDVRKLQEQLKYAPTPNKYKIYIIDEVHMLSDSAFNALLKTLEEPPKRVLFVFATTEPHKVPATIISRCQRFDFKRISINEIIDQLKVICQQEDIKIDDESLYLIARKAEGSMRDSQSLLDQAISFCGTEISSSDVTGLFGIIDWDIYFRLTDFIVKKDAENGFNLVEEIYLNGYDFVEFLNGMNEHLRNILITKTIKSQDFIEVAENYKLKYQEIADQFEDHDLMKLIQIVSDAQYRMKNSSNQRLFLETIVLKMIKFDKSQKIETLINSIESLKEKVSVSVSPEIKKKEYDLKTSNQNTSNIKIPLKREAHRVSEQAETYENKRASDFEQKDDPGSHENEISDTKKSILTLEEIKERWGYVIKTIKTQKIAFGSFLEEGEVVCFKNNTLELAFGRDNGFHVSYLNDNQSVVEKIVSEALGTQVRIKYATNKSTIEPTENQISDDIYLEKLGQKIPILKTIVEIFDGERVK